MNKLLGLVTPQVGCSCTYTEYVCGPACVGSSCEPDGQMHKITRDCMNALKCKDTCMSSCCG